MFAAFWGEQQAAVAFVAAACILYAMAALKSQIASSFFLIQSTPAFVGAFFPLSLNDP